LEVSFFFFFFFFPPRRLLGSRTRLPFRLPSDWSSTPLYSAPSLKDDQVKPTLTFISVSALFIFAVCLGRFFLPAGSCYPYQFPPVVFLAFGPRFSVWPPHFKFFWPEWFCHPLHETTLFFFRKNSPVIQLLCPSSPQPRSFRPPSWSLSDLAPALVCPRVGLSQGSTLEYSAFQNLGLPDHHCWSLVCFFSLYFFFSVPRFASVHNASRPLVWLAVSAESLRLHET